MSASEGDASDGEAPPVAAPKGKRDRVRPVQKKRKLPSAKNQLRSVERLLTKARTCAHARTHARTHASGTACDVYTCTRLRRPGGAACVRGVCTDGASLSPCVRRLAQVTDNKARAALELRRAALLKGQEDTARGEKERKLAVRYHKVKFFGARWKRFRLCRKRRNASWLTPFYCSPPSCAERKKVAKAQTKLRAEIEKQGWVRGCVLRAVPAALNMETLGSHVRQH
jgi:hypothetical protein